MSCLVCQGASVQDDVLTSLEVKLLDVSSELVSSDCYYYVYCFCLKHNFSAKHTVCRFRAWTTKIMLCKINCTSTDHIASHITPNLSSLSVPVFEHKSGISECKSVHHFCPHI